MFGFDSKTLLKSLVNEYGDGGRSIAGDNKGKITTESNKEGMNFIQNFKSISQYYPKSPLLNRMSSSTVKENKVEIKVEVKSDKINLNGDEEDKFILVPDFFNFNEIDISIPFFEGKKRIWDSWHSIKQAIPNAIPVHPSSFGSLHDRACEIFYELKGGKIDYGKEHSRKYCHSQFGLYYEGVLKEWNEEKPIVLIGKGYGAQTILYLQYLLAIDFFKCQSNDKWIKAVITIEGSLRGSTLPYVLGLKPFTKSVIHPISILQLILSLIHLLLYFNLPVIYLFGLQLMNYYWNLSKKQQSSFWCALIGRSSYSNLEDNFIYDYSLEGAAWHSKLYPISSNCIYLNYVISNSMKSKITGYHLPRPSQFKRFLLSWFLGRFQFIHNDLNEYEELTKYWPNNGLVPTICQLPPKHHPNQFKLELHNKILDPILYSMELGKWHTIFTCQQNMRLFQSQQQFYESNIKNTYQFYLQYHLDPFYLLIMETIEQCLIKIYSSLNHQYLKPILLIYQLFLYLINYQNIYEIYLKQNNNNNNNNNSNTTILEQSDESALIWARQIETKAFLQSPSSIIRWMNQTNYPSKSHQFNMDAQTIRRVLESKES